MTMYSNSLKQTLEASYKETKEPHTIADTLVIVASIMISKIMFSEKKSHQNYKYPTLEQYNNRKKDEIDWACRPHGREDECIQDFRRKT
jgi:hypothetical protein